VPAEKVLPARTSAAVAIEVEIAVAIELEVEVAVAVAVAVGLAVMKCVLRREMSRQAEEWEQRLGVEERVPRRDAAA
jgi:hypothetical protein